MSRQPPLYTPEAARAEAEREGDHGREPSWFAEGCGCCLIEALAGLSSCIVLVAVPLVLMR